MVADVRGAGCANPRSKVLPHPLHRSKVSIDREEISEEISFVASSRNSQHSDLRSTSFAKRHSGSCPIDTPRLKTNDRPSSANAEDCSMPAS